ncbi:nicotinamidase-related amidase [Inhella inkyongensis]|uniref:Nicotinamidase-related amidase n=1 Tax=Inhella inkyongensis TaxID=392593 RepID=A0A840S7S8_9BURK|nr:isochorismatase family protein [Inhella inkyongensis]MBB5205076.1 nicotinamidase-related amidase [Inhella inkyongensis]
MTAALLMIDLQCGAFDGLRCDPMPDGDPLLANCRQLLDAARRRGQPVIWVQHAEDQADSPMHPQGPGFAIDPRLDPKAHEPRIIKTEPNAFSQPDLMAALQAVAADQVVLAGLQSEVCVSATATAALALGLGVTVVRDGHHTWPHAGHSATEVRKRVNEDLEDAGAKMISTKDYCAA